LPGESRQPGQKKPGEPAFEDIKLIQEGILNLWSFDGFKEDFDIVGLTENDVEGFLFWLGELGEFGDGLISSHLFHNKAEESIGSGYHYKVHREEFYSYIGERESGFEMFDDTANG